MPWLQFLGPMAADLDPVALILVLVQAVFLWRVAVRAEGLRSPRLLAAAKVSRAILDDRAAARAGERVVAIDALDPWKRQMLERLRVAYSEVGSLDDLWEPFLLRFLVATEWNESEALRRVLATGPWRRDNGAAAVRRKFVNGFKLGDHAAFVRCLDSVGVACGHRRASDGDLLSFAHVGSFDPDTWLKSLSDDDWEDVALHVCEYLTLQADRLSQADRVLVRHALVLDYANLGWRHLNPAIFFRLRPVMDHLNLYYPEFVGSATLINTPALFVHLWAIVSPWISEGVRMRVQTADPEHTPAALAKLAPPSSLPQLYGGTCDELPNEVRARLGYERSSIRGIYEA